MARTRTYSPEEWANLGRKGTQLARRGSSVNVLFNPDTQEYVTFMAGEKNIYTDFINKGYVPTNDATKAEYEDRYGYTVEDSPLYKERVVGEKVKEIQDTMAETFGEDFYGGLKSSYTDLYGKEIEEQYKEATGQTVANLASRGVLNSSVGAESFADLLDQYEKSQLGATSDIQGYLDKYKEMVRGTGQELETEARAAGEIGMEGIDIASRFAALPQPGYEHISKGIGDLFDIGSMPYYSDITEQQGKRDIGTIYG